jgi:hypothetical protein
MHIPNCKRIILLTQILKLFQLRHQHEIKHLVYTLSTLKLENYSNLCMVTMDAAAEAIIDIISTNSKSSNEIFWLRDQFVDLNPARR